VRVNAVTQALSGRRSFPSTMPGEKVTSFGENTPLGSAAQPAELAPAYVFLASDEAIYVTGALLPVPGGRPML